MFEPNNTTSKFTNSHDELAYQNVARLLQHALDLHHVSDGSLALYGMNIIERLSLLMYDYIFVPGTGSSASPTEAMTAEQSILIAKDIMMQMIKKAFAELSNEDFDKIINKIFNNNIEIPGYKISVTPIENTTEQSPKSDDKLKDFLNNTEDNKSKESKIDHLTDSELKALFRYVDTQEFKLGIDAVKFIIKLAEQRLDPKEDKYVFCMDLLEGIFTYCFTCVIDKLGSVNSSDDKDDFHSDLVDGILSIKIMMQNVSDAMKERLPSEMYHNVIRDLINVGIYIPDFDINISRAGSYLSEPAAVQHESSSSDPETKGPGCGGYSCESCWDDICKRCHDDSDADKPNNDNTADTQRILSSKWDNIKISHDDKSVYPSLKLAYDIDPSAFFKPDSVRINMLISKNEKLARRVKKLKRKNKKLKKQLKSRK